MAPRAHDPLLSVQALLAAALACACVPAVAAGAHAPELRFTLGAAVVNSPGSAFAGLRYGNSWGAHYGRWLDRGPLASPSPRHVVGVDRRWAWKNAQLGLGAVWIDKLNDVNGTHLNFDLSLSYRLSREIAVELRHFSHGKLLGIKTGAANKGWNFVGLGWRF